MKSFIVRQFSNEPTKIQTLRYIYRASPLKNISPFTVSTFQVFKWRRIKGRAVSLPVIVSLPCISGYACQPRPNKIEDIYFRLFYREIEIHGSSGQRGNIFPRRHCGMARSCRLVRQSNCVRRKSNNSGCIFVRPVRYAFSSVRFDVVTEEYLAENFRGGNIGDAGAYLNDENEGDDGYEDSSSNSDFQPKVCHI